MSSEQQNQHPAEDPSENTKRNSGKTGPTTSAGRATSSRNATRHGLCSETLVLSHESQADWLDVLDTWLGEYQNPAENSILYNFIFKTARAEWSQLRAQKEYDYFFQSHGTPPITAWEPFELKAYELVQRYLTTAERRFQREYRMLEHHWKTHHKPLPEKKTTQPDPEPETPPQMPIVRFINTETGESVDQHGNHYPPPPDFKPITIIPGVYGPKHPAYQGPPQNQHPKRR